MRFAALAFALLCLGLIGCSVVGGAPGSSPGAATARRSPTRPSLSFLTPTPLPGHLLVDHNGTLSIYALPLSARSRPQRNIVEAPGAPVPPQIAVDPFGDVALASATQIQFFRPPVYSFAAKHAYKTIALTAAITQMGPNGAVLADLQFDPNLNLWIANNYGGGQISELTAPFQKYPVAATRIAFGVPGTKAASYGSVRQIRFDVNATLYAYATQTQGSFSLLFKSSFPYVAPIGGVDGLDLQVPDFVDPSQWPNGPPYQFASGVIIGQYNGLLASPAPGKSPPPTTSLLVQFTQPLMPQVGVYPQAVVKDVSSALVADPGRGFFYSLRASDGELDAYPLPLESNAIPQLSFACAAKKRTLCNSKPQHIFLAP